LKKGPSGTASVAFEAADAGYAHSWEDCGIAVQNHGTQQMVRTVQTAQTCISQSPFGLLV
jgi:hypothetical protein